MESQYNETMATQLGYSAKAYLRSEFMDISEQVKLYV